MPAGKRTDPLVSVSFFIDVSNTITGTFRECSGLGSESEVVEHVAAAKGGQLVVHKIPGVLKWENIVLKRGVTDDMQIWDWRKQVEDGSVEKARKNGSIIMYNQSNEEVARWNFENAWPVKISGPSLNAGTNEIAIEELTIAHESLERVK
jgi:phage tail-like protein